MTRLALICSLAALTGCTTRYTHPMAINNWAAVQWLPQGAEVAVRTEDGKHTGTVQTVSSDSMVVRGKTGPVSIARSDILRVSRREACRSRRTSNTVIDGLVFSLAAALLLPFHHGSDTKLFGAMTAAGVALGATASTTTYRESDIYVRR
jgi:hypothetical protein